MADSNNVVSFASRKVMKDAEPAIDQIVAFRHFYDDNADIIQCFVDFLMDRLMNEYCLEDDEVLDKDYTLLMESAMAIIMRANGIEHPICHPVADQIFSDRPTE